MRNLLGIVFALALFCAPASAQTPNGGPLLPTSPPGATPGANGLPGDPGAITSLNGLTTPLATTQGGTGATSGLGAAQNLSSPYVVCEGAPTAATVVSTVASPVAAETNLATCAIPANAVSTNGQISILVKFIYNPSGNTDVNTMRVRYDTAAGVGGTQYMNIPSSTTTLKNYKQESDIAFNGNTQVGDPNGAGNGSWGASAGTASTGALSIASASYINITGQIGAPSGNDQLSLAYYRIVIYPSSGN